MDTEAKLKVLADASRYDLACACGTRSNDDHRQRNEDGMWLYPVSLPNGGTSIMLKTLLSNVCVNDCRYCPLRTNQDIRRCTLSPEEVAKVFMHYVRTQKIHGLFLSSGVVRDPDHTMARMNAVAEILRTRKGYRGYIHLKVLPGASLAAIERSMALASAVSLNVEVPTRSAFAHLASAKDYEQDIVAPMKHISRQRAEDRACKRVRQTTQFLVGASTETDSDIIEASSRLYKRLGLNRVYFSAYQRGLGEEDLPGETRAGVRSEDLLTREHRLYQVDWLMRKYGFQAGEIPFEPDGNLSLTTDPKEVWARAHPAFFPVDVNRAPREVLLRVPGFGHVTVERILSQRRAHRLRCIRDMGSPGKRLRKAEGYLRFT